MWVCQMDGHGPATWAFYYFSEVITGSSWLIRGQKSVPVLQTEALVAVPQLWPLQNVFEIHVCKGSSQS